ncbi:unnamed protein product [Lactuca virosa]|uniref:Uncharacterized protein n=1 Tax=Lactuca virosa TaxID=75947 RepID=A0AAU9NTI7_9ASTR|nr:unnamed protein product [Lactuca virosa]
MLFLSLSKSRSEYELQLSSTGGRLIIAISTFGIRCVSLRPPLLTGLFACMITKNTCFVCCKCKCRNDYDKKIDLKLERL